MTRQYKLKRRAQQQELTRDRIVDAVMALHEEVGPRNTTISAIAERAGVQRLTVYRHFPDEVTLFQACTSRWIERNPPPAPEQWQALSEPGARSLAALQALYGYYRRTEPMWAVSYRDEHEVPALQAPMGGFRAYLATVVQDLLEAWAAPESTQAALRATLGHAVDFPTWQSLSRQGLGDEAMAALVTRWLAAAAG
jgi:AcrR family transcriptional regulator